MPKYNVTVPYRFYTVDTVDAENKDAAIEKVMSRKFDQLPLCHECETTKNLLDHPCINYSEDVIAEEVMS